MKMLTYESFHLLSAEFLVEERIEYNDFVNSLQDENISCGNKQNDILAVENEDAEPKNSSVNSFHFRVHHQKKNTSGDRGGLNGAFVRYPKLVDVKLAQAKYLLSRLAQFKTLVSDRYECAPSVFSAGDFNSVLNDK
ncbi:hypothetical protein Pint_07305 [Pistacia integerrima]|uniref:Uncharacterized protein n=1 Tax=Pistacia integerrima TaxID=434235 RepID=A0ACC0XXE1_9ROSI|nr:hypothetical protein Pint_07305 [Pistacia integerrima]